jgi:hypothetical protein
MISTNIKNTSGGNALTSGGFGCFFKPALKCKNTKFNSGFGSGSGHGTGDGSGDAYGFGSGYGSVYGFGCGYGVFGFGSQ